MIWAEREWSLEAPTVLHRKGSYLDRISVLTSY